MKDTFCKKAQENYLSGYACSESIIITSKEFGLIPEETNVDELMQIASAFANGLSGSGCLCGSVSGSQIIIGLLFGRNSKEGSIKKVRKLSAKFVEKFKEKRKATCCRVLTMKYKDDPKARKHNCSTTVIDSAGILFDIVSQESQLKDTQLLTH